ncbi:unnamed protein product [Protopolystoma xenopodis]|uniref:Uncharacterized protein n=1 Tax=Protopolystoma xenopodis TaxID=117903 RepID=A0A3S5A2F5_9PLAT|nr:unnamed protein product [Protopolystoma xenopodis]
MKKATRPASRRDVQLIFRGRSNESGIGIRACGVSSSPDDATVGLSMHNSVGLHSSARPCGPGVEEVGGYTLMTGHDLDPELESRLRWRVWTRDKSTCKPAGEE